MNEARIVNRGDSYSVHHLPEDWTDDIFAPDRGVRGTRFTHWLHTHPNAPAIPSGADADAAQETIGVDLIIGVSFSPEGPRPVRRCGGPASPVRHRKRPRREGGGSGEVHVRSSASRPPVIESTGWN